VDEGIVTREPLKSTVREKGVKEVPKVKGKR
jgi:hypothetical protein